jgi:prepilin-type N-terminal cleavage/methylation domain-containing protein
VTFTGTSGKISVDEVNRAEHKVPAMIEVNENFLLFFPARRSKAGGFTMLEIMIGMAILAVLMILILPVLASARRSAQIVQCKNNLRLIYTALKLYDNSNNIFAENYPGRLTHLYPSYVVNPQLFICPLDQAKGKGPGLKPGNPKDTKEDWREGKFLDEKPCSYLYEFSMRPCGDDMDGWWYDWLIVWEWDEYFGWRADFVWFEDVDRDGDGIITWQEAKFFQLDNGDIYSSSFGFPGDGDVPSDWPDIVDDQYPILSYSRSLMPLVRCFWHMPVNKVDDQNCEQVLNLALDGNLFDSGPAWEPHAYRMTPKVNAWGDD